MYVTRNEVVVVRFHFSAQGAYNDAIVTTSDVTYWDNRKATHQEGQPKHAETNYDFNAGARKITLSASEYKYDNKHARR